METEDWVRKINAAVPLTWQQRTKELTEIVEELKGSERIEGFRKFLEDRRDAYLEAASDEQGESKTLSENVTDELIYVLIQLQNQVFRFRNTNQ